MNQRQKDIVLFLSLAGIFLGSVIALPLISFDSPFVYPNGLENLYFLSSYVYMIITFLTLIVVLLAATFSYGQLKEISNSRKLGALSYLLNERLNHKDTLASRDFIANKYCEHPEYFHSLENMPNDVRDHCRQVFYVYSEFGAFLRSGLIEERFVKDMLHVNPVMMWIIMKHYIIDQTKLRGYDPYFEPFRRVVRLGFKLFKASGGKDLTIHHFNPRLGVDKKIPSEKVEGEQSFIQGTIPASKLSTECHLPCCPDAQTGGEEGVTSRASSS